MQPYLLWSAELVAGMSVMLKETSDTVSVCVPGPLHYVLAPHLLVWTGASITGPVSRPEGAFWHFGEALACSSGSCQKQCQTFRCFLCLGLAPYVSTCATAAGRPPLCSQLLWSCSSLDAEVCKCTLQSESQFVCSTSVHYKVNAGGIRYLKVTKKKTPQAMCAEGWTAGVDKC